MTVDELATRVGERIASEFRGFWCWEELYEEIPALIREEGEKLSPIPSPSSSGGES